jgi:hypothetical protein
MRHAVDALKEITAVDIGLLCFIIRVFVVCLVFNFMCCIQNRFL